MYVCMYVTSFNGTQWLFSLKYLFGEAKIA